MNDTDVDDDNDVVIRVGRSRVISAVTLSRCNTSRVLIVIVTWTAAVLHSTQCWHPSLIMGHSRRSYAKPLCSSTQPNYKTFTNE